MLEETEGRLLGSDDPAPVDIVNGGADHPVVLVCEHAGRTIPRRLGSLGLDPGKLDLHIAFDLGAERLCRALAERLGAMALLQRYSRLVIDGNRPTEAPDSIPTISDHVLIPGNVDLSSKARQLRRDEIFRPFHRAVGKALDRPSCKAAFSIHSFTPVMDSVIRPWDISFLYRQDDQTSARLAASIATRQPELTIGFNQPYRIDDASDWFVPRHAEGRNLPHSLIEIRNDHLTQDPYPLDWTALITEAINTYLETP